MDARAKVMSFDVTKKQIILNTPDSVHNSYGISCFKFSQTELKEFFYKVREELSRHVFLRTRKNESDYFGLFRQGYDETDGWCYCEALRVHPSYMAEWEKDCFLAAAMTLASEYKVEVTIK